MTDYSKLIEEGRIEAGRFSEQQVEDCLQIARRDLEAASDVLKSSAVWAFNIAYNAMHQAGRAFLFHEGFRAVGEAHHATVVRFLEIGLGRPQADTLALLDRMRRIRNQATYDAVGMISPKEAGEAVAAARAFVDDMARRLKPRKA
jgi:uncharacterized protein (UPF0332 family)